MGRCLWVLGERGEGIGVASYGHFTYLLNNTHIYMSLQLPDMYNLCVNREHIQNTFLLITSLIFKEFLIQKKFWKAET